jgi:hypothetical protein
LDNELAISQKNIKIEGLVIDKRLVRQVIGRLKTPMLEIKYWIIKTRNNTYRIGNPDEYIKLIRSLNSQSVRFVKLENDLVNINQIEYVGQKLIYKDIKKKEKEIK